MKAKVKKVISEIIIQLDQRWNYRNMTGSLVKIKGLLPSEKTNKGQNIKDLESVVMGKEIEIYQALFVSGGILSAILKIGDTFVQDFFPARKIPIPPPTRNLRPEERRTIKKVLGGIPETSWVNPILVLDVDKSPQMGNIAYPIKPWDKDFADLSIVANELYSDSHYNKREIDRWFTKLITDLRREAPVLVVGEVGIGKSWMIANKLMQLPRDKYHVVIFDLRNMPTGEKLERALELELHEFLNYYIPDLSWLYPDFKPIYGEKFDPSNPTIFNEMKNKILSMDIWDINRRRLRYYSFVGSPDLVIVFDNIDHFTADAQEKIVQMCRHLYGSKCGIKAVFAVRPTTMLIKHRLNVFFGDSLIKTLHLRSPDIYKVIENRLTTNSKGKRWPIESFIPGTNLRWSDILREYKDSDNEWGLAGLLIRLCSTYSILNGAYHDGTTHQSSEDEGKEIEIHKKYDLRYYLRLFRRVLRSNWLQELGNIPSTYYGIQALMLRGDEPLTESESYLFNLFDNEQPLYAGNSLIRYRTLEYCETVKDMTEEVFTNYFRALGYDPEMVRLLVKIFETAGLVELSYFDDAKTIPLKINLTIPGERHMELITNLWYIICIKTGMNIYEDHILFGYEAKKRASEFVRSEKVLDDYSKRGWVPEEKFISFLAEEEALEDLRLSEFQQQNPEMSDLINNWFRTRSYPSEQIYWDYHVQLHRWRQARLRQQKRGVTP